MTTKHERAVKAAQMAVESAWQLERALTVTEIADHAVNTYLAVMREPGLDEVRVRVCVAVGKDRGRDAYDARGWDNAADQESRAAIDLLDVDEDAQFHFIEANVPAWAPPAEVTVEGEVAP